MDSKGTQGTAAARPISSYTPNGQCRHTGADRSKVDIILQVERTTLTHGAPARLIDGLTAGTNN